MSNRKDLFYIHLFNDFSGSPRVLKDAIDSVVNEFGNTYLFTSQHKGFLDDVNITKIKILYFTSNIKIVQLLFLFMNQFCLMLVLSFFLARNKINGRKSTVVINTMLPFGGAIAAKLFASKIVYYVHESYIKPIYFKKFLRYFINYCASHVIFVSNYLKDAECFNLPQQSVIYNGLRSDFPKSIDIDVKNKFKNKMIFFAGSLKSYKGIDELVSLASSLPEFKFYAAMNCSIIELDKFVANKTLSKNIFFISRPNDIYKYYENSFAVLNLTLPDLVIETFGLSLVEGMSYGSPVVAPPIGGPTEFVNKSNGLLIDSRQTKEIVLFLRYLNSSLDIWELYSNAAIESSVKFSSYEYKRKLSNFFKVNELL